MPRRRTSIGVAVLMMAALGVAGCSTRDAPQPADASRPADASQPVSRPTATDAPAVDFRTLAPGEQLRTGAQCARLVRATPGTEVNPANADYNRTTGQRVGPGLFPQGDSPQATLLSPLISGEFTGTTQQILEWAACKWGIDQDIVFAQAAAESSWDQNHRSDWGTDPALCPPGHDLGADGVPGQCPQSYGILQTKYIQWRAAWPGIADSTAMNADVTYAIWRSCFDGDEIWLNHTATSAHPYRPGDLWGCIGRWFAGSWYAPAADRYIQRVQRLLAEQVWTQPGFIGAH